MSEIPMWLEGFPGAVTVCDRDGVILYMNPRAQETFARYGGRDLIGQSLFACHGEAAGRRIRELLRDGTQNAYTIEKKGQKKLIWQTPWWVGGVCAGLVELSLEIPEELPHFVRDGG